MPSPSRSREKLAIGIGALILLLLSASGLRAGQSQAPGPEVAALVSRVEASYARVESYQTEMEVREYRKGKYLESKRFLYTFRKPGQLRIDMQSPKPGTILVYPDRGGKVTLRPGGWTGIVTLHLAPDSALLASGSGQRIDQSDFGLLLRNIRHSLSDGRRGPVALTEAKGRVTLEVLSDDHFLPGVQTLYRFVFDSLNWLPLEVHESTAQGLPKRASIFGNLKTSVAVNDRFFRLEGAK